MKSKTKFSAWIRETWIGHHWLILAIVVFVSVLYELFELLTDPSYLNDPLHVVELVVQGAILPALLIILDRTETQKNDAINTLALHDSLVYQLNKAQDWNELIEIIVQFPRSIVPLSGVRLWMQSPNSNKFDLEFARVFETSLQMPNSPNSFELKDMECCREEIENNSGIRLCKCALQLQNRESNALHARYCLPLSETNSILGMLHLYLPTSYKLSKDQKDFLGSIVPEIALSINEAALKRKSALREAAMETERFRLASDLHDTLGQDLAYLRNKIDQLIQNHTFR